MLGKSAVERSVAEKCCREGSVGEQCCREVLEKSVLEGVGDKRCREVLQRSTVSKCWARVL